MAQGQSMRRIAFSAFATALWYSTRRQTRLSSDHLIPSLIIALVIAGLSLWLVAWLVARDVTGKDEQSSSRNAWDVSTLRDGCHIRGLEKITSGFLAWWLLLSRKQRRRWGLALISGCILLRLVILVQIWAERACSRPGLEAILLPLLILLGDYFEAPKSTSVTTEVESMSYSIFQELYFSISMSRFRYVMPVSMLSYSVYLLGRNTTSSTYICPAVRHRALKIVSAQMVAVVLDAAIIIGVWRLVRKLELFRSRSKILEALCNYSAIVLCAVGIFVLFFNPGNKEWVPSLRLSDIWSAVSDGFALTIMLLWVSHLTSKLRPVHFVVLLVFVYALKSAAQTAWTYRATFPPQSKSSQSIGLLLLIVSFVTVLRIFMVSEVSKLSHKHARPITTFVYLILAVTLIVIESLYLTGNALIQPHPINSFMYKARIEGDRWRVQASSSISLSTAVQEYQLRHGGRNPPPNFDKWYSFAMAQNCPVIDDYKQISDDLLGFWDLHPREIRQKTTQQLQNNDVEVILIREGHADPASSIDLDETWPLNETVAMINKFSRWLPDMDIAIRINDDSRPAVPWNLIEQSSDEEFHGFMPTPALGALKNKDQDLIPVFSRSKSHGYDDILIPGPNDFIDFTKPGSRDLEQPRQSSKLFSEMEDILFWRGPAEEGESASREWQGMLEQRLVHLTSNLSSSALLPILLPSAEKGKFCWENIPARELTGLFRIDTGFTKFEQCSQRDCKEQKEEFGTKPDIDNLWDYRYLIDLEARGNSQKFISILRSSSLPIRISTSRSWFDERLMPYLHYMPQSAKLYEVYSTLAYFAGLRGTLNGRDVDMPPHFRDAQFIADQGWKWAEKALRRQDAEAYLFRLLLEWGRMTNDRRDEMGFRLDA